MLPRLAGMLVALTLLVCHASAKAEKGQAPSLRIGYQVSPPVQYISADGRPFGPVIELINRAAARQGISLEWIYCPEGPDKALSEGKADLWPLTADISRRRRFMSFSEPYMRVRFWILTRGDSGINSVASMKGRSIAHARGSLYSGIIEQLLPPVTSVPESTGRDAVRALCESKVDAALLAQGTGDAAIVKEGGCPISELNVSPIPGGVLSFGIAARKANIRAEEAADKLQREVVRLFDEGVLSGIWLKWGLHSTETRMLSDYLSARRYSRWLAGLSALLLIAFLAAIWLAWRLRKAQKIADSAARAKASFLANMSHEIRTPMNGVLGVTALLSGTNLGAEQREYVSLIQNSAVTLLRVLNDVLDVVKTDSGSVKLQSSPFDLQELGRETILLLRPQAETKGLKTEFHCDAALPKIRIGDGVRVAQILHNLVGNAVKYTRQGSVGLKIEAAGDGVCLRVWDTGDGLPEDLRTGVFEKFSRGKEHEAAGIEGTGLGLYICNQLVKLMGGRIEVASECGRGAEFRVCLPLPAADGAKPADPNSSSGAKPAAAPARQVLLVEDNAVNQLVASRMLERLGCAVTIASNGEDAIELSKHCQFDLVFMDCRLPGLDGFETASIIRGNDDGRHHIPIIALTASAYESDRQRCIEAGMDDHVGKPISLLALQKTLEKWTKPANEAEPQNR